MNLNPEQLEAVTATDPRVVVVASPGSGKTAVLAARAKRVMGEGKRITCLTFTTKAAAVLRKRIEENDLIHFIGTSHSYALRICNQYGDTIGLPTPITIMSGRLRYEMVSEVMTELGVRCDYKECKDALELYVRTGKQSETPTDPERVAYSVFRRCIESGILGFDMMMGRAVEIIKKGFYHPVEDELLVDEVQDSSDLEFALYSSIGIASKVLVGDPDQSIYEWRGASPKNFVRFAKHPNVKCILLPTNYRSGREICRAATSLIGNNVSRVAKDIIPNATDDGKIETVIFKTEDEEIVAMRKWSKLPGSRAILCRSNREVQLYKKAVLEEEEVEVTTNQIDLACDCLSLIDNPWNNSLAKSVIKRIPELKAKYHNRKSIPDGENIMTMLNKQGDVEHFLPSMCQQRLDRNEEWLKEGASVCVRLLEVQFPDVHKILKPTFEGIGTKMSSQEFIAALSEDREEIEEADKCIVSTVHKAKGLEWDHVWMPGFASGVYPYKRSTNPEEDRRCAFVALTRARHSVMISIQQMGPYGKNAWSQYLGEMRLRPMEVNLFD